MIAEFVRWVTSIIIITQTTKMMEFKRSNYIYKIVKLLSHAFCSIFFFSENVNREKISKLDIHKASLFGHLLLVQTISIP